MKEILVAGGGIGGLAAALALARTGRAVRVLERADRFTEIGYGLQLGPNAFRMLSRLGIGDRLRATAFFPERLVMLDALDGSEVTSVDLGPPFVKRFGAPYSVIHRSDLLGILLDACRALPAITLETNCEIVGFQQADRGVDVQLGDGSCRHGALLVGADGIRSQVRDQLHGASAPRPAGQMAFRGVVPIEAIADRRHENAVVVWVGHNMHMVQYRLRGGTVMNTVAVVEHEDLRHGEVALDGPALLASTFAQAVPQVQQMLEFVNTERSWVLCDREPRADWVDGNVVLLGDAAHPTLQYLAQGACMALEDAVTLAGELADQGDCQAALERYASQRYLRTARVQLTSRFFCGVCHAGGAARDVRNAMLRQRDPTLYPEMAWLYAQPEEAGITVADVRAVSA